MMMMMMMMVMMMLMMMTLPCATMAMVAGTLGLLPDLPSSQ